MAYTIVFAITLLDVLMQPSSAWMLNTRGSRSIKNLVKVFKDVLDASNIHTKTIEKSHGNTSSSARSDWQLDPACNAGDALCSCSAGDGEAAGYFIENNANVQRRKCKGWCSSNSAAWLYKCNWWQCAACMGDKEAGTGCCMTTTTTTTTTTMDPSLANAQKNLKNGLLCSDMRCLKAFKTGVSWLYNYKLLLDNASAIQLLNENGIEFVPMADRPVEWATSTGKACTWVKPKGGWSPAQACDVSTLVDTVTSMNKKLTAASKAKYLMMFNEAYLDCASNQCQESHIEPSDLVEVWRKYFIPAAKQLGLDLVSPTFKGDEEKYQSWAANVLAECYKLRNEANLPCDVRSLKKLSVHAYQCSEKFYQEYYTQAGPYSWTKDLMVKLATLLGSEYDNAFFSKFFAETPVWVTEFSCAADGNYDRYPDGFTDSYGYGQAPYDEQCRRASGQKPASHGRGVVKTLTSMDEIERFSWFGAVVASDFGDTYVGSGNNLITRDEVLMPTGRLLVSNYSDLSTLNCSMPIEADTAGDGNGGTNNPDTGFSNVAHHVV